MSILLYYAGQCTRRDEHCCKFLISDWKSVKSCVVYLTKKTKIRLRIKLSLLHGSSPKSARASPQQCTQSAPDIIQIGLLSTEL